MKGNVSERIDQGAVLENKFVWSKWGSRELCVNCSLEGEGGWAAGTPHFLVGPMLERSPSLECT